MILENVANLDQLPERAQVVVAPLKLSRANGGPARIFALLPAAEA
jgi:kynurenine formamidase